MKYFFALFIIFFSCNIPVSQKLSEQQVIKTNYRQPDIQPDRYNVAFLIMDGVYNTGAGQIFNLPRTDDFSRRGKVPSHLTAKVVSTVAFQNKIKNLSCTL